MAIQKRDPQTVGLALAGLAAVLAIAIHAAYTSRYFFLLDDYGLVGQAATLSIREIFGTGLLGFYRPAVFLLVKALFALFAWQHPAGYLAVLSGLHVLNAALLFAILRRFSLGAFAALFGAALFVASAWSTEGISI